MATVYFNTTVVGDGDVGNLLNYFSDAGASMPLGSTPGSGDHVIFQTDCSTGTLSCATCDFTAANNNGAAITATCTFGGSFINALGGYVSVGVFNDSSQNQGAYGSATFNDLAFDAITLLYFDDAGGGFDDATCYWLDSGHTVAAGHVVLATQNLSVSQTTVTGGTASCTDCGLPGGGFANDNTPTINASGTTTNVGPLDGFTFNCNFNDLGGNIYGATHAVVVNGNIFQGNWQGATVTGNARNAVITQATFTRSSTFDNCAIVGMALTGTAKLTNGSTIDSGGFSTDYSGFSLELYDDSSADGSQPDDGVTPPSNQDTFGTVKLFGESDFRGKTAGTITDNRTVGGGPGPGAVYVEANYVDNRLKKSRLGVGGFGG